MGKHTDQTRSGHSIKFPTKWWKNSWLIVVVVLITLIAGTSYLLTRERDSEYFFEIGTYTLDETKYNSLREQAGLFFVENFDELLLNYVAEIEAAKKIGLSVTNQEIIEADDVVFSYYSGADGATSFSGNEWRQLSSERRALIDKLAEEQDGNFSGAVLEFSFFRYIYPPRGAAAESVDMSVYGDEDLIEADRLYALALAQEYVETLKQRANKAELQRMVDVLNADERVGEAYQSRLFGYDVVQPEQVGYVTTWFDEVQIPDIMSAIRSANESGVGEIITLQGPESWVDPESELIDIGYGVYYVDEVITPSDVTLQEDFEKARQDFGWMEEVQL